MPEHITLIDFGSTFTKGVVIDPRSERIAAQSCTSSTVETDVREGLNLLLRDLSGQLSPDIVVQSKKLACSSAAGGLRMVVIGLIPELTLEAGRKAAFNAGAKIVGSYSGELTPEDLSDVLSARADIILLTGGTDGGNRQVLLANAEALAGSGFSNPVIVAGNKNAAHEVAARLQSAGIEAIRTENVMPYVGKLNLEPARQAIRELFIRRIAIAKGISGIQHQVPVRMPTPDAVLHGIHLIADGTEEEEGLGELLAVDVGGATTDVYSVASGAPTQGNVNLKGLLPEPYIKRTVEGDLGMRHNAATILETAGCAHLTELSGLLAGEGPFVEAYCRTVKPEYVPDDPRGKSVDAALAKSAVELAVGRHAGSMEISFLPGIGETYFQTGKDLRSIRLVIGTGGPVIHSERAGEILSMACWDARTPMKLKPQAPGFLLDRRYLLYAIGLLSRDFPALGLHLAKRYLEPLSSHEVPAGPD